MTESGERFPRAVFDEHGAYTIRRGASYRVDDFRIRELAEIGYARRDLEQAHTLLENCIREDLDKLHPLLEECLWTATIVMYSKPFGRNNARTVFKPEQLLRLHLGSEGLKLHEYIKRCRDWMIAHDDGLGESKETAIYLPPTPPRSTLEIGLHNPNPRVVALGTDIARQLEPHFAHVRELFVAHEYKRRHEIASELLSSRFAGMQLLGEAIDDPLAVDPESVLLLPPKGKSKR